MPNIKIERVIIFTNEILLTKYFLKYIKKKLFYHLICIVYTAYLKRKRFISNFDKKEKNIYFIRY